MEPDPTELDEKVVDLQLQSTTPPLCMGDPTGSPASVFDKHRALTDWLLANDGYFHPDVQIAFSARKGYHVVAVQGKEVPSGTRVASCPMSLTLSVLNALNVPPFSSHGTRFPDAFLRRQVKTPQSLQAFFLMEQLVRGPDSWWAPYIATLPTVLDVAEAQFEDPADVCWLRDTNLQAGLLNLTARWEAMYHDGLAHLQQLGWPHAVDGSYSWPLFRWAASMFGSRSFTSKVLDDTLPADTARLAREPDDDIAAVLVQLFSDQFAVLLPVMDLLNHKPGAKVEWQARYSFVGLQILEHYAAGLEVFNNYGPKENEGLLLSYGFTISHNPFDHFGISIKPPPGSPLAETRTWKPDARSDPERRCFIFGYQHPQATSAVVLEAALFSFDLLDSLSVLCANERELQAMFARKQTSMSRCLGSPLKFEDGRIVLATLSQLLRECMMRAARLRSSDPAAIMPVATPLSAKQRHAKCYRECQVEIIETAIAVCQFVLQAATTEARDAEILARLRPEIPDPIFHILTHLTDRYNRITHPFELLTPAALLEMLPTNLSRSLGHCLAELEAQLAAIPHTGTVAPDFDKPRIALCLSALYEEYTRGVKFSFRISAWLKQLIEWYPSDPDSWAYVPTPGPWSPGEEPPRGLVRLLAAISPSISASSNTKRWLQADRLCWGWNVMEEEAVQVPSDLLSTHSPMPCESSRNSTLIYWRQS